MIFVGKLVSTYLIEVIVVENDWCTKYSYYATYKGMREFGAWWTMDRDAHEQCYPKWRNKRIRVTCSRCGRRMFMRLTFCSDGCCEIYRLPRHKIKYYWKPKVRKKLREK